MAEKPTKIETATRLNRNLGLFHARVLQSLLIFQRQRGKRLSLEQLLLVIYLNNMY